jgi:hypothetical protein
MPAWKARTKLQKAGRAFLLRLVAEYGPREAARVLRALADELEAMANDGYASSLSRRPGRTRRSGPW